MKSNIVLGACLALTTSICLWGSTALAQDDAMDDDAMDMASFTQEQVDAGQREYTRSCQDCHGPNLDDGEFGGPPLVGYYFREKWFGMSVAGLYGFTASAMPPDRPGQLSAETYADLVAFILSKNDVEPGETPLPSDMDALSNLGLPVQEPIE